MRLHSFLFIAILSICSRAFGDTPRRPLLVFISDTHIGLGKDETTKIFDPFEDFRYPEEFDAFLRRIDTEGAGATHLIVNGDAFELWQSASDKSCTEGRGEDDGCTEAEALTQIRYILDRHQRELASLKAFASSGENRIFFVPGNHDAALLFATVADEVVARIGAPSGRVMVLRKGYYLSEPDHRVYAEHGHQLDDSNALTGWPTPFRGDQKYLFRPWGQNFVQSFYNAHERDHPTIDNVSGFTAGIKYGLAADGVTRSAAAVGKFAKFLLFKQSFRQFTSILSDQTDASAITAQWNLVTIRAQGNAFFVQSVATDDPTRPLLEASLKEGTLDLSMDKTTDAELQALCDYRYAVYEAQVQEKVDPPTLTPCESKTLKAGAKKLISLLDEYKFLSDRVDAVARDLHKRKELRSEEVFDLVILSHTHQVETPFDPRAKSFRSWRPLVANTGAWQRIASPKYVETLRAKGTWKDSDVLAHLTFDVLPACYPAILVRPFGTSKPKAEVVRWEQQGGRWDLVAEEKSACAK
jgi:UDP-2,3-diacylglucosamine pyrophosphatase LpxH